MKNLMELVLALEFTRYVYTVNYTELIQIHALNIFFQKHEKTFQTFQKNGENHPLFIHK